MYKTKYTKGCVDVRRNSLSTSLFSKGLSIFAANSRSIAAAIRHLCTEYDSILHEGAALVADNALHVVSTSDLFI